MNANDPNDVGNPGNAAPSAAPSDGAPTGGPEDRATSFQAVKGEPEHYSGEVLLVSAYAAAWVIILAWIALVWRKQAALGARLDDLERVIDEAATTRKGPRRSRPDSEKPRQ